MFKVYINGICHSTHSTFTGACRHARIEAAKHQHAYFTVFEADDMDEPDMMDDEDGLMYGVPAYIITPPQHAGIAGIKNQ